MSVHLADFPEAPTVFQDPQLHTTWTYLFQVRSKVQFALEQSRRDKVIGSSLDATVILHATEPNCTLLKRYLSDLPALFIVSCVKVEGVASLPGGELVDASLGLAIEVVKAEGIKCDRCWNIRQDVGSQAQHPMLCGRCVEAVG